MFSIPNVTIQYAKSPLNVLILFPIRLEFENWDRFLDAFEAEECTIEHEVAHSNDSADFDYRYPDVDYRYFGRDKN